MSAIAISGIIFASVSASAIFGMFLRSVLPEPHKNTDSMAVVRVVMGLVVTLVAMVLSLLIASAKGFYDTQVTEMTQFSADVILLDRALAYYGPDTAEPRRALRASVIILLDQLSQQTPPPTGPSKKLTSSSEIVYDDIQQLTPKEAEQRSLKKHALKLAAELGNIRWLMYEQKSYSVSMPLLGVLVFWLIATFISFGIYAPSNATVITSLLISALSVSAAIFLLLEMYTPYTGLIHISSAPLREALANLGQ